MKTQIFFEHFIYYFSSQKDSVLEFNTYSKKVTILDCGTQVILTKKNVFFYVVFNTVTSRLFTHIVSTEKSRKEMRDRKDPRGEKHTNYNAVFLYCF